MIDLTLTSGGDVDFQTGDLAFAESTEQHKHDLLVAGPGDYKESPLVGVSSVDYLLEDDPTKFLRTVRKQFERDGMRVRELRMNNTNELIIDAAYENGNR